GQPATVGQKIGILLAPGEKLDDAAAAPASAPAAKAAASAPAPAAAAAAPAAAVPAPVTSSGQRIKASPLARKIAAARGIDLGRIKGTGPGGRIVSADVVNSQPSATIQAVPGAIASITAAPVTPAGPEDNRIALSGMRRV